MLQTRVTLLLIFLASIMAWYGLLGTAAAVETITMDAGHYSRIMEDIRTLFLVVQGAVLSVVAILIGLLWRMLINLQTYTRHEVRTLNGNSLHLMEQILANERRVNEQMAVFQYLVKHVATDEREGKGNGSGRPGNGETGRDSRFDPDQHF